MFGVKMAATYSSLWPDLCVSLATAWVWPVSSFLCNVAWLCCFCPLSHIQEESPLSVSSPDSSGPWLHYTCGGVGSGARRRRRSGDPITSSPVSPKSLAFTSTIFGSWQQVFIQVLIHFFILQTYKRWLLANTFVGFTAAVSKDT